jgi:hypothetical protein
MTSGRHLVAAELNVMSRPSTTKQEATGRALDEVR